jgi:hypothetical protein
MYKYTSELRADELGNSQTTVSCYIVNEGPCHLHLKLSKEQFVDDLAPYSVNSILQHHAL